MKKFTKSEITSLIIIFAILISVSIPNFLISLRRARDQVRRDDIGSLQSVLKEYADDFDLFPPSSADGKIVDCLKPGDSPAKDASGQWVIKPTACEWGQDAFKDLINGKVYLAKLPRDPDYQKGVNYLYLSDGYRFQIYASMEGMDEAEIDPKIIARNLKCGTRVCNVGRSYKVPVDVSIEEYTKILESSSKKP